MHRRHKHALSESLLVTMEEGRPSSLPPFRMRWSSELLDLSGLFSALLLHPRRDRKSPHFAERVAPQLQLLQSARGIFDQSRAACQRLAAGLLSATQHLRSRGQGQLQKIALRTSAPKDRLQDLWSSRGSAKSDALRLIVMLAGVGNCVARPGGPQQLLVLQPHAVVQPHSVRPPRPQRRPWVSFRRPQ